VGGAIAYAGFLALIGAAIIGLATVMPAWLSALIIGGGVAVIGYSLIQKGLNDLKPKELVPRQTIESLKETKAWAQEQI
jgi:predicted phage tail protein